MEKDRLGLKCLDREAMNETQCAAVGFVDNNDLIENGEKVNEDMQIMLNRHTDLHAATEVHVEEEKQNIMHGNIVENKGGKY